MLWDRLQTRRFAEAVQLAEDVMSIELDPADAPSRRPRLNAAFEDLLYVLTKYLCIYLIQIEEVAAASKVLNGILRPKVERERAGTSRGRGEWFIRDLNLLGDLIDGQGSGLPGETNPYAGLDWVREFEGFWGAARLWRRSHLATADPDAEHTGPLFARALGEFFCDAAFDEAPSDAPSDLSLPVMYDSYSTWQGVRSYLVEHEDSRASRVTRSSGFVARKVKAPKSQPTSGGKREGSAAIGSTSDVSALVVKPAEQRRNTVQQSNQTNDKTQRPPFDANPATIEGITDSAQGVSQRQTSAEPNRKGRRGSRAGLSDEHDRASGASHFSVHGKNDADMPPQPVQLSSADFALASTCGPVMNEIRALDVTCVPETGEVIAATAGSHDRSDRRISLWDVRRGTLLAHLDNATSKPITCLAFHPDDPRLLLSADMEFDVKLWEWRSGTLLRSWKKMHTRIIFRTAFVPSSAGAAAPGSLAVASDRAATCSGDQSIKIFALNEDDLTPTSSVHANEPFTSFIFVGSATDPAQMKLVASLSYSIRIYRLRTATLLHTIQMKDLRDNKTPITALAAHPVHDAYVLISCDNQLRLVNLLTETTVKIYQSRAIPTGTRVDGQFSPCGGWVYCGTWDVKGRVKKDRDQSSSSTSRSESGGGGIVVWKLHTARADRVESAGVDVAVCKWIAATENSRAGDHRVIARKVLVAAGLDRMIRMYM
ncbi:hypothetical protein HKX48_006515 [Thoreauomyces humboldtii]|nr:hypothetical protein HKX48_006515 [Thoreauomyces humboldtii]